MRRDSPKARPRSGWHTAAPLVAILVAGGGSACGREVTPPTGKPVPPAVFSGTFTLVRADDWINKQACNYVAPADNTVCGWGRLTVTSDSVAISVRGSDVHLGGFLGPLLNQDSSVMTLPLRVINACTVAIDSIGFGPNGRGTLTGDSLRFDGRAPAGDSLSWVYRVDQVVRPPSCT
jgi:hypothetical protein